MTEPIGLTGHARNCGCIRCRRTFADTSAMPPATGFESLVLPEADRSAFLEEIRARVRPECGDDPTSVDATKITPIISTSGP